MTRIFNLEIRHVQAVCAHEDAELVAVGIVDVGVGLAEADLQATVADEPHAP